LTNTRLPAIIVRGFEIMLLKVVGLEPYRAQSFSFSPSLSELDLTSENCRFGEVVAVRGEITYTGTVYRVTGEIDYERFFACDRCLKPCCERAKSVFDENFSSLAEDSAEATHFDGDAIDLSDLVRDTILVSEPLTNLCREDCLGLCSVCGHDLNEGDCGCERKSVDPRLEKLLELKI